VSDLRVIHGQNEIRGGFGQPIGECLALVLSQADGVPEFQVRTHTEQHHVAFESRRRAQLATYQDPAGTVEFEVGSTAEQQPLQRARRVGQLRDLLPP
jgi:hypothetical protein